jgi:hypothetical protein
MTHCHNTVTINTLRLSKLKLITSPRKSRQHLFFALRTMTSPSLTKSLKIRPLDQDIARIDNRILSDLLHAISLDIEHGN